MKIFDFVDYDVVVDPVAWTLRPFRDILNKYKGKKKYLAIQEMAYVFFFTDWQSDYSNIVDKDERKTRILEDIFVKDKGDLKIDDVTSKACEFYKDRQKTISMDLYEDAKVAVNKIRGYFRAVDLTATDNQGKPLYDISKLTKAISDTSTIISKLKELEEIVKKEKQTDSKLKGIEELGFFER